MPHFDPLQPPDLDKPPLTLADLAWALGLGLGAALLVCLPLGAWLSWQI